MFSDSVYGGKEAARRAARKFKKSAIAKASRSTGKTASRGRKASRKTAKRGKSRRR